VDRIPRLALRAVINDLQAIPFHLAAIAPSYFLAAETNLSLPSATFTQTVNYIATDHLYRPSNNVASIPYSLTELHHSAKFHQPRRIIRGMPAAC